MHFSNGAIILINQVKSVSNLTMKLSFGCKNSYNASFKRALFQHSVA